MENMNTQELMSALADGQLQGEALARGLEVAASDPAAVQAWHSYHLIGDVLRSADLAGGAAPGAFLARLRQGLQQEQPFAPAAAQPIAVLPATSVARPGRAANDASGRWKLVAGFASVAAVAAIGWTVVGGSGQPAGPQLAGAGGGTQAVAVSAGERGMMLRDPRLDQLMQAHRQFGGTTALQAPAGFLRNATFEGPAR